MGRFAASFVGLCVLFFATEAHALPPIAQPDFASTLVNKQIVINVLANDSDPLGQNFWVNYVSVPQNGTANMNYELDPVLNKWVYVLRYTPNFGFTGTDSFIYRLNNAAMESAEGQVTVTVYNNMPVAAPDVASILVNKFIKIKVLENDSDPDGQQLFLNRISQLPTHGTASIISEFDAASNKWISLVQYTPNWNFVGTDSFYYRVQDEGFGGTDGLVTVTVYNNLPVSTPDFATILVNKQAKINVLSNDSDQDGQQLFLNSISQLPTNGTASIISEFDAASNKWISMIQYVPNLNFVGTDTFMYRVQDEGFGYSDERVTVTVYNNLPIATPDSATILANTSLKINVLANDSEPDGQQLWLNSISQVPTNGTATLLSEYDSVTQKWISLVQYTPNTNFTGTDKFTYRINDEGLAAAEAEVTITVYNNAPVAVGDSATTLSNTSIKINVLANDSDPDGQQLFLSQIKTAPKNGTAAIINENGVALISYTPKTGFYGSDSLVYVVQDQVGAKTEATVTITVQLDKAPIAKNDSYTVLNSVDTTLNVLANDVEPNGQKLTITSASKPYKGTVTIVNGGVIKFTPKYGATGSDSFTYTITDGRYTAKATVTLYLKR